MNEVVIVKGNTPILIDSVKDKFVTNKFAIMENAPEEHHFYVAPFAEKHGAFLKTINKEVSILRNCLPQGIFVKSFEDRMDLFSAMIQGPKDTPYEGGIFFFDIYLPKNYPKTPPKLHYISFHDVMDKTPLNPNLYINGKVCMSILGTWKYGPNWDSNNSTLLQVLVSIQGLVLTKEPFWNEPGNLEWKGIQECVTELKLAQTNQYFNKVLDKHKRYNRDILLLTYKSINNILKNPPKLFELEIEQHFELTRTEVLTKVKRWTNQSKFISLQTSATMNLDNLVSLEYPIVLPDEKFIVELNVLIAAFESNFEEKRCVGIAIKEEDNNLENQIKSSRKMNEVVEFNQIFGMSKSKVDETENEINAVGEKEKNVENRNDGINAKEDEQGPECTAKNMGATNKNEVIDLNGVVRTRDSNLENKDQQNNGAGEKAKRVEKEIKSLPRTNEEVVVGINDASEPAFRGYDYDQSGMKTMDVKLAMFITQSSFLLGWLPMIGIVLVFVASLLGKLACLVAFWGYTVIFALIALYQCNSLENILRQQYDSNQSDGTHILFLIPVMISYMIYFFNIFPYPVRYPVFHEYISNNFSN